ncbi:hypothetical protein OBBRIDRAFT_826506 [Obba rivulosa]|uniref:Uncharacterized protein n=1 Tax=Obba rivulosa TaxID=1052685 RepID=A0A8E2DIN3_9APHY|nr:hypothetical protein OBBRIDRAFT_826506 [Obba rivulosa]
MQSRHGSTRSPPVLHERRAEWRQKATHDRASSDGDGCSTMVAVVARMSTCLKLPQLRIGWGVYAEGPTCMSHPNAKHRHARTIVRGMVVDQPNAHFSIPSIASCFNRETFDDSSNWPCQAAACKWIRDEHTPSSLSLQLRSGIPWNNVDINIPPFSAILPVRGTLCAMVGLGQSMDVEFWWLLRDTDGCQELNSALWFSQDRKSNNKLKRGQTAVDYLPLSHGLWKCRSESRADRQWQGQIASRPEPFDQEVDAARS